MTNSNSFLLIIFREGSECEMQYALGGVTLFPYYFMSRSFHFTAIALLAILLSSCMGGKKQERLAEEAELDSIEQTVDTIQLFDETLEPPVAVDELFDDFFFNFASNARFQNQRIRFPLRMRDDTEELKLSKEEWHRFNRFGSQEFYSVIYDNPADLELQKDTAITNVRVDWVYLQDGYVEQYNFRRLDGKWILYDMEKEDVANTPNGDFVEFYSKFISDSTYQCSSIRTPLRLVTSPGEMEAEEEETSGVQELTMDDWLQMKSEMPLPTDVIVNINYGQVSESQTHKNLLMEGVSNGLFVTFKFDKSSGSWHLLEIEI